MSVPKVPYQDGIEAYFDWYRDQPGVPQRGPKYDPKDDSTWPWPDKLERTFETLKDGHNSTLDRLAAIEAQLANRPFFP